MTGKTIAKGTVSLTGVAILMLATAQPAASRDGCNDYEDWWEIDTLNPDDPHHMWNGGDQPTLQEPDGEWEFEGYANGRKGTNHGSLNDYFTDDSMEHPVDGCSGGGES
ncbi:MAG: hypothetical protein WEA24_11805 [Gemmatimonadota bacterium]